ncbi:MAG: TonB-dependent receptor [Nevskia sp.]|nr:TonB-dependent receptor [Nevskia sp.]
MKIAALGLALAPAIAFAADPGVPSSNNSVALAPVVVTATRTDVPEADTLAPTIVIDRAQIERAQATDVAQILQQYAGLDVARSGGPGQPASLFIRGGNSNYTLVLIDGVRVNNDSDGAAALANISPEMIERIEVLEGPRSTLYGTDAIGGVVNIITRGPGPAQLDLSSTGGSFDTVQGGAALRDAGKVDGHAWGVAFGAQQQYVGGFPTYAGAGDDGNFRNRTLNGKASIQLGGIRLEARAWDAEGYSKYVNANFDPNTFAFLNTYSPADERFNDRILALQASTHLCDNWASDLTLSRGGDNLHQGQAADFVRTIRPEADWHNVLTLGDYNRLSFGALASRERVDALSFGTAIDTTKDNDYAYLQDELNVQRNHAVLAVSYLHDGGFGERFNWSAEYGFDLTATTKLIASAGSAFHAPTANDRFGFGGNPALQPEKAMDYELGLKQRLLAHQDAELRLFRTDVRDLILGVPTAIPPNFFTLINARDSRTTGAQADWSYVDERWTARVDGVVQNPRTLDNDSVLLRRSRLSADALIQRHLGRYDVGAHFYAAGRRQDIGAIDGLPTTDGGYGLLDLNAGVRLTRELRFDLRGANVLNHHYQTAAGYNQPGSAVYASLRYSLPL